MTRKLIAGGCALVVLGAAVLLTVRSPREPARESGQPLFDRPVIPAPASQPTGSLTPAPQSASDLDALFELFRETGKPLALQSFAQDVVKEPALKAIVDEFRADQKAPDRRENLETFARKLSNRAEFRALVARFSPDPGFRDAALKLTEASPRVAAIVRSLAANRPLVSSRGGDAFRGKNVSTGARRASALLGSQEPSVGAITGPGPQGAGGAARAGVDGGGISAFGPGAGAISAGQAAPEGARTGAAEGTGNPTSGPGSLAAGGVKVPLDKLAGACSQEMDHMLREWLAAHNLQPNLFLSDPDSGIWDKCFSAGKLKECVDACNNPPQADASQSNAACAAQGHTRISTACNKPSQPSPLYPYWDACIQARFSELDCINLCRQQDPPCKADPAAVSRLCSPSPPATCPQQCLDAGACNAEAERAPGKPVITYRCQQVGVAYNGSYWRWHPISQCTDGKALRCPKQDGNACPANKGRESTVRCNCP